MGRALLDNWALFVGILMLMCANGLLVTLLTIQGSAIGFSETEIGLMQAAYPLGALFGCVYAPRMVQSVGHVRAFGALASLSSIAAIVHLITSDPASWGAMRLLTGFCFPGLYVISEAWLNAKATNRDRATILSIYFVVQTLGASLGQALAGLDDAGGTRLFGLTSILISLSLVPLLLSQSTAPPFDAPERLTLRGLLAITPMPVAGAALNGAAQACVYIGLPLYGLAVGLGPGEAALLVVTATLAGAAMQFPAGWLSDRIDRRLVVLALAATGALAAAALAAGVFGRHLYVAAALLGAVTLPVYSLCVAHANDHLAPGQVVPASGTLVLTLNAGVLAGAFLGPASFSVAGPQGFMAFLSGLAAATAAITLFRRGRREAPERSGPASPITVQGAQNIGPLVSEAPDER